MPNMSYVRFENTYRDLMDCYGNMDEDRAEEMSLSEQKYRLKIIELCGQIAAEYGDTAGDEE